MTKRNVLLILLAFVFMIAVSGCNTLKCAGEGAMDGAQKDWKALKKADNWLRKTAW